MQSSQRSPDSASAAGVGKRVCIIQPVMKGYREPFFRQLESALAPDGIRLTVQYGRPWAAEALRGDNVALAPPLGRETANLRLGLGLMLQPALRTWWGTDLVIVEHANKHALNYLLMMLKHRVFGRLAYWGHGRDRQGKPTSRAERFKRRSLHWADWWFAYTAGAAQYVADEGFPASRITTVENAVDTAALRHDIAAITPAQRRAELLRRGWNDSNTVAVYCGSLYPNKRLPFLLDAARRVHAQMPGFRLLVLGGGPEAASMAEAAAEHPGWLRFEGPRFGSEKALSLSIAQVCMNPGLVGLGILDAFCAGLPMLTTDLPIHSPEIEYLVSGVNGLMTSPEVDTYAAAVLALLHDPPRLQALQAGAHEAAERFSVETMVRNFAAGVRQCLQA